MQNRVWKEKLQGEEVRNRIDAKKPEVPGAKACVPELGWKARSLSLGGKAWAPGSDEKLQ